jgi:hypothetical protein
MESETHQTVQTNESIISVPTDVEHNLTPQSYTGSVPETLLAIAVLIRSLALLIQVIGQQKRRK